MKAETFARELKKYRKNRGWTQVVLAKKAGLESSAVSHFETGRRLPSVLNLVRLADALQMSTNALLAREPSGPAGPRIDRLLVLVSKMQDKDMKTLLRVAEVLSAS